MSTYCLLAASVISIHAPREGCDGFGTGDVSGWRYFNPRTPRGVRLDALRGLLGSHLISIHAPREGCDEFLPYPFDSRGAISIHAPREGCDRPGWPLMGRQKGDFNPRTPRGVRLFDLLAVPLFFHISIHAPREGCDRRRWWRGRTAHPISIHAPREGCDVWPPLSPLYFTNFNPRTPRGVRP